MRSNKALTVVIALTALNLGLLSRDSNAQSPALNSSMPSAGGVYNDTSEALQYSKAIVKMIEDFIRDDLSADLQPKGQLILQNAKHALVDCEGQLNTFTDITKYNQCAEFLLHSSLLALANLKKPVMQHIQPDPPKPTPTAATSGAGRLKLFW